MNDHANEGKSKVLLIDDHPIVRQGLVQLINEEPDLVVCGEASSAREAMDLAERTQPDVAVVDISLEDRSGVELIKDFRLRQPKMLCLALSMYDESMYGVRVLRAGGRGYIMKQEVTKKVITAIRRVVAGGGEGRGQKGPPPFGPPPLWEGGGGPPLANPSPPGKEGRRVLWGRPGARGGCP